MERMHSEGACVGTDAPGKWFPLPGFADADYDRYASWACRGCPVQAACLTYAVKTGQVHGVWGGLAEHRLAVLVDVVEFGTPGGHGHPATGIDTAHVA